MWEGGKMGLLFVGELPRPTRPTEVDCSGERLSHTNESHRSRCAPSHSLYGYGRECSMGIFWPIHPKISPWQGGT